MVAALGGVDGRPVPWVLPICCSKWLLFPASWCFPASGGELEVLSHTTSRQTVHEDKSHWQLSQMKPLLLSEGRCIGGVSCVSLWAL